MILVDLNVLLDVVQRRHPHYAASAAVLDERSRDPLLAAVPAHAVTTLHYIVGRYSGTVEADRVVDWLLARFAISAVGREELVRARSLGWADLEEAVVAAGAESSGCRFIITRNARDFVGSPVPAVTPEEYLLDAEGDSVS